MGCFKGIQFLIDQLDGFRPLAGCGLFHWVGAGDARTLGFRPLAGCGLFHWVGAGDARTLGFRPLAGCGLFRQSCTLFLVQQEKELSTLLFYCIILEDGLSIAN